MTASVTPDTAALAGTAPAGPARPELEHLAGQLRQALRTERLLRAAVQASPVNLTISDARRPNLPLIFVNDAFCRTTGYGYDEVIGTNCRFLQGPDTDPDAVGRLREAIAAGRAVSVELLNYRRSGEPFWNFLNVAPVLDADGTITAYVGVQHDTTAERRAEDAERQRQKLEALGRLAGGVAHEINNLLQPALAFPELIAAALPDRAVEERQWLAMIESHSLQARGIVRDILTFARAEPTDLQPLEATPAVGAALDFVAGVVPPSVQLVRAGALALGQSVGWVRCEPGELRQVLANLVANAAHALEMRGTVTVKLARGAAGALVHLDVADTGPGMRPEVRARVFEPFFTTKGVGEGTGLGLSIVYGIVQRWGGRIEVDSAPGAGTRVRITLPLLPDRPGLATAGSPRRHPKQMAKILVIDDVAGVRASVVNTLKRAGHEVFEAATGADGLALARQHGPDLVITDILMPEIDGLETIDLIQRDGGRRRPRFLAISGGGSLVATDDALKAASRTADAVLAKPFLGAELMAQVSKILEA